MADTRFAEMIAKMAHELRSPLTSVKGFSATLVKRWDAFTDEQRRQFVETIHKDSERMARVISEVVDLARIEAGRLELQLGPAHLRSLCEKAVSNLSSLAGAERATVEVPDDLFAWADVARLEHVLTNLIENAAKYSDEGRIEVTAAPAGEGRVEMVVSDQGVGIEPERLDVIFEPPSGPAGDRSTPSGPGLGLYLSRRLVEAHGGTLAARSEVGQGSAFTVELPAARGAA